MRVHSSERENPTKVLNWNLNPEIKTTIVAGRAGTTSQLNPVNRLRPKSCVAFHKILTLGRDFQLY